MTVRARHKVQFGSQCGLNYCENYNYPHAKGASGLRSGKEFGSRLTKLGDADAREKFVANRVISGGHSPTSKRKLTDRL